MIAVRVIDYHLKPGEKEPMHSHPPGVVVHYFADANVRWGPQNGPMSDRSSKAGDIVWRDPVTHLPKTSAAMKSTNC
jgi:hypothetical protein